MVDRRAQRRRLVHDEVRGAARALMHDRGFGGVTVEEIAAMTSVSASTIYRHFGTKEALVLTPGRPVAVASRVAADEKRIGVDALRRAVNKEYGKDPSALDELQLVVSNAGLLDQFRREWLDAAPALAAAVAVSAGRTDPTLVDRASAGAMCAASSVCLEAWASDGGGKLRPYLDDALVVFAAAA